VHAFMAAQDGVWCERTRMLHPLWLTWVLKPRSAAAASSSVTPGEDALALAWSARVAMCNATRPHVGPVCRSGGICRSASSQLSDATPPVSLLISPLAVADAAGSSELRVAAVANCEVSIGRHEKAGGRGGGEGGSGGDGGMLYKGV
jgi:hypothetical protein